MNRHESEEAKAAREREDLEAAVRAMKDCQGPVLKAMKHGKGRLMDVYDALADAIRDLEK
jgi:hypothetical protein